MDQSPAPYKTASRWKKIVTVVLTSILVCISAIVCAVGVYSIVSYRQARAFLTGIQAIKVGEPINPDTIDFARRMQAIAYVKMAPSARYFYVDPLAIQDQQYANLFEVAPLEHCSAGDCTLSIRPPSHQVTDLFEFSLRHPRVILPAFYWIFNLPGSHRWLPIAWFDPVMVRIEKGVVQELDIQMRSEAVEIPSEGWPICPRAEVVIQAENQALPFFNAESKKYHMSGADCSQIFATEVHATSGAYRDKLADALDFNLYCLLPGGYCTDCQMLPMLCKHYRVSR